MPGQPFLHLRVLVRGVVVDHGFDQFFRWNCTKEYCIEFARVLQRRAQSQDDLIGAAVLDAAVAQRAGMMCKAN